MLQLLSLKRAVCITSSRAESSLVVRQGRFRRTLFQIFRPISSLQGGHDDDKLADLQPFGIIAAVSQNSVIGINGDLPWKVPADRKSFEDVTRHKTLIIGRKTLLLEGGDTGQFQHVAHCRRVVVVSRTLHQHDVQQINRSPAILPTIDVASSVQEAIRVAQRENVAAYAGTVEQVVSCSSAAASSLEPWRDLDCWIGGGEDIYATALNLPQAQFLHLTVLDVNVPISANTTHVARFPQHWQSNYRLVDQTKHSARDPISFVTYIYKRIDHDETEVG